MEDVECQSELPALDQAEKMILNGGWEKWLFKIELPELENKRLQVSQK